MLGLNNCVEYAGYFHATDVTHNSADVPSLVFFATLVTMSDVIVTSHCDVFSEYLIFE